jgi:hypothetical protein
MSNFNNNICELEYEGDNNFYDDFSSMEVNGKEEVSEEEVSEEEVSVKVPTRRRKRRRATTPPRKRRRINKSSGPNICSRIMNFMGDAMTSLFFKNK